MKIAILGTGTVAQTLANVLSTLGYPLMLGTRQVTDTLHRKSFADWHQQNQSINIGNFEEAAAFGDCIINALQGHIHRDTGNVNQNETIERFFPVKENAC